MTPATAALQLSPRTRYVTAPYASNDGKGGAVLTAGTPCHLTVRLLWWCPALTPAGGWPVLCAKLSLQALRFARWTPYGAMDPVAGCRWGSGTS